MLNIPFKSSIFERRLYLHGQQSLVLSQWNHQFFPTSNNEHLIHRFQLNPFQEGLHRLYTVELVFTLFQTFFSRKVRTKFWIKKILANLIEYLLKIKFETNLSSTFRSHLNSPPSLRETITAGFFISDMVMIVVFIKIWRDSKFKYLDKSVWLNYGRKSRKIDIFIFSVVRWQ